MRTRGRLMLRGDRGAASLELAILGPALLLMLSFAIWAGRTQIADNSVQEAARAAAREASIALDAGTATSLATAQANATLTEQNLKCQPISVDVDTSGFAAPLGVSGDVTVTVACTIGMSDLLAPGLPGSVQVEASFTSPVDAYRER